MNELRLILLIFGLLLIVFIYLWESAKRKKKLRSRVDNYPTGEQLGEKPALNPKKEFNIDVSDALRQFSHYLRQTRQSSNEDLKKDISEVESDTDTNKEQEPGNEIERQSIITLYVISRDPEGISGDKLMDVMDTTGFSFGDMDIFHYPIPSGDREENLFSLANIHEPGVFDISRMSTFSTRGVVIFLCLPASVEGERAFNLMLEKATEIAEMIDGQICDRNKLTLTEKDINRFRQIAANY